LDFGASCLEFFSQPASFTKIFTGHITWGVSRRKGEVYYCGQSEGEWKSRYFRHQVNPQKTKIEIEGKEMGTARSCPQSPSPHAAKPRGCVTRAFTDPEGAGKPRVSLVCRAICKTFVSRGTTGL